MEIKSVPVRTLATQATSMTKWHIDGRQRVAIVTGGAQGLGEAISRALADGGDKVVIADMNKEAGKKLAESIGGAFVDCDVSHPSSVESLMAGVAASHGSVDVVVANAGIAPVPMAMHMIADEDWHKMMLINGFGVFVTCKHAVRQMLKQESGGVILGMSSTAGLCGVSGVASYTFAKHGIIGFTKTVATEYAKRNIRMNCICPAGTETPMVKAFLDTAPASIREAVKTQNPVPGLLHPSDVANAAAMLCAPNNPYLTGVAMPIDGGHTACSPSFKDADYVEIAEAQQKSKL